MDSGGIGKAVASSFNQHPPQFMIPSNTVEDLQKSGVIDPVHTYMHSYVYLSPPLHAPHFDSPPHCRISC